jgi:mono/diheme cytochrome c family protein
MRAAFAILLIALVLIPVRAPAADATQGHAVYDKWCAGCHAPAIKYAPGTTLVGRVLAGTYALEQLYKGSLPAALEQRTDLAPDYVRVIVRSGRNLMPATRKTEISDAELDALVVYLTSKGR